jgi:hypothetical protein
MPSTRRSYVKKASSPMETSKLHSVRIARLTTAVAENIARHESPYRAETHLTGMLAAGRMAIILMDVMDGAYGVNGCEGDDETPVLHPVDTNVSYFCAEDTGLFYRYDAHEGRWEWCRRSDCIWKPMPANEINVEALNFICVWGEIEAKRMQAVANEYAV